MAARPVIVDGVGVMFFPFLDVLIDPDLSLSLSKKKKKKKVFVLYPDARGAEGEKKGYSPVKM